MIVIDLPENVASAVDSLAGRAGMTPSAWLAEQVAHAFGTGRVTDPDQPRPSRSARRRQIARLKRAESTITETTSPDDHT